LILNYCLLSPKKLLLVYVHLMCSVLCISCLFCSRPRASRVPLNSISDDDVDETHLKPVGDDVKTVDNGNTNKVAEGL